ncbi:hypothetical protein HPP92_022548 [Vanilla planifolia]|uniref:Protein MULTIPLE CHLOROPLAST DIVISION SITE 1 n=1 Tax=Vanilla planifolia TaxID=51239 RepID=A0A835UFF2_VANPL|nr:hypothetical protein HPP92_022548 [Vanilla planifolia]
MFGFDVPVAMSSLSKALLFRPANFVICRNEARGFGTVNAANLEELWLGSCRRKWRLGKAPRLRVVALCDSGASAGGESKADRGRIDIALRAFHFEGRVGELREMIRVPTSAFTLVKRNIRSNSATCICIALAAVLIVARLIGFRKRIQNQHGSVAELVRRGQLRSDRRGISKPLKYEDPFNNPQVKIEKDNSKILMCGKVYRLAPVTLTKEQRLTHQKRRSRAYQWKRPTVFLKEGEMVPPGVDPDEIRWIPSNHPFATTATEIDESLAQTNVFQKDGVPFRVRIEHEALQKKLEALQNAQKEIDNQKNSLNLESSVEASSEPKEMEPSPSSNQQNLVSSDGISES